VAARVPPTLEAVHSERLARILIPLTKIRATRGGIASASAALEIFGGNGYIEDWPLARQLRDAQCHTIWEGTENVLALDVLRAMARENAHSALFDLARGAVERAKHPLLRNLASAVVRANAQAGEAIERLAHAGDRVAALRARRLASDLADLTQAALLTDEASFELEASGSARKAVVAAWFVRTHLEPRGTWHVGQEGTALELFDPLVRYDVIRPEVAAKHAALG
jgi:hypothetical protein